MKRILASVAVVAVTGVLIALGVDAAWAAPRLPDSIAICHRTNSVTNPYRMITVAKSSLIGPLNPRDPSSPLQTSNDHAGYQHNGYDNSGLDLYPDSAGYPNVFTPGTDYTNPKQKVWEDIIPPFTVAVTSGSLVQGSYAGLNWTDEGQAIYFGAGTVGGQSAFHLCNRMTAGEFADIEKDSYEQDPNPPANLDTEPEIDAAIIDDLDEQDAIEDDAIDFGSITDPDTLPDEPSPPEGPTPPEDVLTLTQAIVGKVWFDDNENGLQDAGEADAPNVRVDLYDPGSDVGIQSLVVRSGASIQTTTDSGGSFEFLNVPEGEWQVTVTAPDGYRFTYDSLGTNEGVVPTLVPPGGVGYMWAGIARSALPDTGSASAAPVWVIVAGLVTAAGVGLTALRSRRIGARGR